MNTCSTCKKETRIYYMCDLEDIELMYCPECFINHPCTKAHAEDCATFVAGDR